MASASTWRRAVSTRRMRVLRGAGPSGSPRQRGLAVDGDDLARLAHHLEGLVGVQPARDLGQALVGLAGLAADDRDA